MNNVLKPFFDIVNYIIGETDIQLNMSVYSYPDGFSLISWYVGPAYDPLAGSCANTINTDNLDEDKLDRWVAELNAMAHPEIDDEDTGEESRESIARTENAILDKS